MGAKQSSPAAANGRTRAYSGSDLPSSTSSNGNSRTAAVAMRYHHHHHHHHHHAHHQHHHGSPGTTSSSSGAGGGGGGGSRGTRSMTVGVGSAGGVGALGGTAGATTRPQTGINIPNSGGGAYGSHQGSGSSTPEESSGERDRSSGGHGGPRLLIGSLPAHLSPHLFGGFKCPVCSKFVSSDEMDLHLVMCLTKPRVTYNEDVLTKDAGECAICLEELVQGDTIARLPCLCIYHKGCIDEWFEVNRSCPEHPSD